MRTISVTLSGFPAISDVVLGAVWRNNGIQLYGHKLAL
jgi:hypothetical protein